MLHWIEVQNRGDDLVGSGLASSEECAKAVKGCVDKNGITGGIVSGANTQDYVHCSTYLTSSLNTSRSLSSSPDASGSSLGGGING